MYGIWLAAIVLASVFSTCAHAEALDARDLYRRAEALVQSLLGAPPADHEVINPPANIDPQMALVPPQSGGAMQLIVPPKKFRQQ
jgi:hypothetical protein